MTLRDYPEIELGEPLVIRNDHVPRPRTMGDPVPPPPPPPPPPPTPREPEG